MKLPLKSSEPCDTYTPSDLPETYTLPEVNVQKDLTSQKITLHCWVRECTKVLFRICGKRQQLVKKDGMVVPIPGEKDSIDCMVASCTGQVPHVVRAIKRRVFKCNGQCQMYSTCKLCSHVIAVAEVHGKLEQLVHVHESGKFHPMCRQL